MTTIRTDPHTMPLDTTPVDQAAELQEMDTDSVKLWKGFTKFLLSNIVLAAGALIVLGLLTVWS